MNRYLVIILSLLAIWLLSRGVNSYDVPSQGELLQFALVDRVSNILQKRYQMTLSSVGGGENDLGIHTFTVSYKRNQGVISIEEGRRMILDCLHEYLMAINADEKLRPFLSDYPFKPANMQIAIINHDKNGGNLFDPDIEVFSAMADNIFYYTVDPKQQCYKNKTYESYDDAYGIIKKEQTNP